MFQSFILFLHSHLLSLSLLFLITPQASAQSPFLLSQPSLASFDLSIAVPLLFHLPQPANPSLTHITLNLCSAPIPSPEYVYSNILIVSNVSSNTSPSPDKLPPKSHSLGPPDIRSLSGDYSDSRAGFANVTLINSVGLWISVLAPPSSDRHAKWSVQLGISTQGPLHAVNGFPAFRLEDTDSSSALLTAADSSLFMPLTATQPLPLAQFVPMVLPTPPTLALGLAGSLCALQRLNATAAVDPSISSPAVAASLTTRGTGAGMSSSQPTSDPADHDFRISDEAAGKRTQYLLSLLKPAQNYTAWLFQPSGVVNGTQTGRLWPYINFRTKAAATNCQLVHDVPFCPSVAYAVPASRGQSPAALLDSYKGLVTSNLTSFQTVISTYPCNNDTSGRYSFVSGCGDCVRAYRDWLCAVAMPRCTDPPANATVAIPALPGAQTVFARPDAAGSRTPQLAGSAFPYGEVAPCGTTCTLVAATCPPLVGWQCPLFGISAEHSYGAPAVLGGVEVMGGEQTGGGGGGERAGDRFGNVYCNAVGSDMAYARQGTAARRADKAGIWAAIVVGSVAGGILAIGWI